LPAPTGVRPNLKQNHSRLAGRMIRHATAAADHAGAMSHLTIIKKF
jgi:hypothetical protein